MPFADDCGTCLAHSVALLWSGTHIVSFSGKMFYQSSILNSTVPHSTVYDLSIVFPKGQGIPLFKGGGTGVVI